MSSTTTAASPAAISAAGKKDPSTIFLVVGLIGLAASAAGLFLGHDAHDPARAFAGWLIGASFWLSILIGMLFLTMIWWLFDAGWSVIIRRQFEHFLGGFPLVGLALLPLALLAVFGQGNDKVLWQWMHLGNPVAGGHGTVGEDVLYLAKSPFLNPGFFLARFFLVFAIFSGLALLLRRWSYRMDETGDHANVAASRKLAAAGIPLAAIATTLFAIDAFKTVNYHWFSTMYGVWFFAASMRAALSAGVLILLWQASRAEGLKGILNDAHQLLIGRLMLAFTVFWAYISFSQYFIIYNANIPEETFWYNIRELYHGGPEKNSWWWVSMGLIFLHFFAPFLYLLWYKNKFTAKIRFAAIWILSIGILDLYWNILPQKVVAHGGHDYFVREFSIHWVDVTTFVGVGGLLIWQFLRSARTYRPIPIRDPRINESLHAHE